MLITILPAIAILSVIGQSAWFQSVVTGQLIADEPFLVSAKVYPIYRVNKRYDGENEYYQPVAYEDSSEEEDKLDPDNIDYEDKERKSAMDIANWTYQEGHTFSSYEEIMVHQKARSDRFLPRTFNFYLKPGQDEWQRLYPDCGGNNQSPINIDEQFTEKDDVTEIFFDPSYEVCCRSMEIKNTGRSVEVAISEGKGPLVTGPFVDNEAYYFNQLHFHWGTEADQGSEHAINNQRYDMEMHFVHYNKKYGDFNEASTKPDGLVVLATLFKISESNNPALEDIVRKLEKVKCGGLRYELGSRLNLLQLLPANFGKYYQYQGSLTTPPCSESVTWVIFKNSQNIGRKQIAKFRKLFQDKKCTIEMGTITRDLQPLNERIVYSSTSTNNHYPAKLNNGLSKLQMIGKVINLRGRFF